LQGGEKIPKILIIIIGDDEKYLQSLAQDAVADINCMDGNHKAIILNEPHP